MYAEFTIYVGSSGCHFNGRVLLDDVPILSAGGKVTALNDYSVTRRIIFFCPAGAHTFKFQIACWVLQGTPYIYNCYLGAFNFVDKATQNNDSGSVSCPAGATTTLINQNFSVPSARKLAVGTIKKYFMTITLYAEREEQRVSKIKNSGESNEANYFNWRLLLNDIEQTFTERLNDVTSSTANITYGEGAYGRITALVDPSASYNIKIKCYNGFGSAYNGRAVTKITICPWIIPDVEYEPITLDFPQGSTFYIITEPLDQNPTKTSKIGKKRGRSFGDTTDYYSTASGTNILSHNYTFETIEVANSVLLVSGFGGCISILGVDVR